MRREADAKRAAEAKAAADAKAAVEARQAAAVKARRAAASAQRARLVRSVFPLMLVVLIGWGIGAVLIKVLATLARLLSTAVFGAFVVGLEHKLAIGSTLCAVLAARWRRLAAVERVRTEAAAAHQLAQAAASEADALKKELAAIKAARGHRRATLDPPETWGQCGLNGQCGLPLSVPQPTQRVRLLSTSAEYQVAANAFLETLVPGVPRSLYGGARITIVSVERIQNADLWKGYQVKRQSVLSREGSHWQKPESRFVKAWLFHGTDEQTAPKIIEQGFNRSFCGKNATRLGKGVCNYRGVLEPCDHGFVLAVTSHGMRVGA